MSNCGCNNQCNCNHGAGVVPGPCIKMKCPKEVCNVRFRIVELPASVGTDAEGQPYAPTLGAYTNTVVQYQSNGALYFYDSRGIWVKVTDQELRQMLNEEITNRESADEQLSTGISDEVARAMQAEQYLQQNINAEVNARESDRDNLQANINAEVEAREAEDNSLQSQIDAIVDSTDVKDVVGTYAELESYDKSTLGDNDIIKVLTDETHEGATTYYRYNKTTNDFTFIGSIGPYYTKAEANELLDTKQGLLVSGQNIKTINGEPILGEGNLDIQGGGGEAAEPIYSVAINVAEGVSLAGGRILGDTVQGQSALDVSLVIGKRYKIVINLGWDYNCQWQQNWQTIGDNQLSANSSPLLVKFSGGNPSFILGNQTVNEFGITAYTQHEISVEFTANSTNIGNYLLIYAQPGSRYIDENGMVINNFYTNDGYLKIYEVAE